MPEAVEVEAIWARTSAAAQRRNEQKKRAFIALRNLERAKGIEPSSLPWQGSVLPLNHARVDERLDRASEYSKFSAQSAPAI